MESDSSPSLKELESIMDDSPKKKAASAGIKPDLRLGFRASDVKVKFGTWRRSALQGEG
jgi:hypothetical protein